MGPQWEGAILTKNKKIQIFGNLLKLARKVVTYVEASTGSQCKFNFV